MKVITNNKKIAIEVLSAQSLLGSPYINEIKIRSIGSQKHFMNDYDAEITLNGYTFILFRDMNFTNVKIESILYADLSDIEFVTLDQD